MVGSDIDVDEIRETKDFKALVGCDSACLPFEAGTFDVVLSKTAIEHMVAPQEFFIGVHRVLKPGGVFIWATSNLKSLPIQASRLTPSYYIAGYTDMSLAGSFRSRSSRSTTARTLRLSLRSQLAAAGFERIALHKTSWPCYFAFSRLLFSLMLPVHRGWTAPAWPSARPLTGVYRKR